MKNKMFQRPPALVVEVIANEKRASNFRGSFPCAHPATRVSFGA